MAMTIHEFVNATQLKKLSMAGLLPGAVQVHFPPADTDTFISGDTDTFVAINRVTGRFSAQRRELCLTGSAM